MLVDKTLDEELTMLEKKDIDIRTEMSLIQNHIMMTNIVSTHRDLRQTCDISKIIGMTNTLH